MPATTMDLIGSAVSRINSYTKTLDYNGWQNFWAALRGESTDHGVLDQSMRNDFNSQTVAELSAYVGEMVAAIMQGKYGWFQCEERRQFQPDQHNASLCWCQRNGRFEGGHQRRPLRCDLCHALCCPGRCQCREIRAQNQIAFSRFRG